ncbi:MAG TPA: DUF4870 domain-containing protein [Candidatus Omnitrophota bacterium]|jgi:uncharacterized Tic20 family protein|nr:DUF4870 domain-containing protein [Candidatus Omnitrophota bacterium]HPN55514.1 DUF4870 domain-containing protein [Candidatus Omnitrophota bacterium]
MEESKKGFPGQGWAIASHLSVPASFFLPVPLAFFPLFVWAIKKRFPFVREQVKQTFNFQITLILYLIIFFGVAFLVCYYSRDPNLFAVGWIFPMMFYFVEFLFAGIAVLIKIGNLETFDYPWTIEFIKERNWRLLKAD